MSDDTSRRTFLTWLGVGAGAAVGGLAGGCTGPGQTRDGNDTAPGADTSEDGGGGDTGGYDTAPGSGDAGDADASGTGDASDTAGPGPGDAGDASDAGDANDTADAESCRATGDDVEGPFHADDAPERQKLAPDDEPGRRIQIEGTVYGPDCTTPVPGALLDVWHANDEGDYYDASDNYRLRGQLKTADDGTYQIRTIKPGRYDAAGGERPAHIHFIISSPQHGSLTTQMYFAGDPRLAPTDPCGGCSSEDPTLIVDFQTEQRDGGEILVGQFDIVLS
ncbi:MAG: hypothetical protein ABEN55_10590 [Bradymonadaceae bacterium]